MDTLSTLLKRSAYFKKTGKTTLAHLSINKILAHPEFKLLQDVVTSIEENISKASAIKTEVRAARKPKFTRRVLANEVEEIVPEHDLDSEVEVIDDKPAEENSEESEYNETADSEGSNEDMTTEEFIEDMNTEELRDDIVEDLDALINKEIQTSRNILAKANKKSASKPTKIKLSRATIAANKKAVRSY